MSKFQIMRPQPFIEGLNSLINHINEIRPTKEMRMIEIGSYVGESTSIFCKNFKEVLSIDPFHKDNSEEDNVYLEFIKNMKKFKNIKYIRKLSDDAILDLKDEKFDFVYIDGDHLYEQVKKDILNYLSIINLNGFIAIHDYSEEYPDILRAVNETLGEPDKIFLDTSWLKHLI